MVKDEIWRISLNRASSFFRQQKDIAEDIPNRFYYRSCRIFLEEFPASGTGIFSARRIRLRMEGEDADVLELYHRFFLQFLSAGG